MAIKTTGFLTVLCCCLIIICCTFLEVPLGIFKNMEDLVLIFALLISVTKYISLRLSLAKAFFSLRANL